MKTINIEKQKKTLVETTFPPQVMAELIHGCNISCVMCPIGNDKLTRKKGMMSFDLFKKVVDEIAAESPATKLWPAVMGEPMLLGERLFTYLNYARDKNVPIYFNTNATLLNDEYIAALKTSKVAQVLIGLDAYTDGTYSKIRRKGDFKRVVANVKKLLKICAGSDTVIVVQFIEMMENQAEAEKFKNFWLEHGAVVKMRVKQGWGHLVGSEFFTKNQSERNMPCPWLMRNLQVLWDGQVCQCDGDMDNRYPCGDVTKQSIKSIWQGEMKIRRDRHIEGDFDFMPCRSCGDWQTPLSDFYYPGQPHVAYTAEEIAST